MSGPPLPLEDERLPTTSYHDYWEQPIPGTDKFQKWKKVRVLGRGSFGTLRLVRGEDGTARAVKEISKFTTPTAINCQELHALIKLKLYPDRFVQFYGWWEDHESIYFAMEYIEQGDLMALLARQKLPEDDGRDIAKQLIEGLDVMHRNHLCHRDLKPENILVVSSSPGSLRVKLADFGCAKLAVGTYLQTTLGTDGYIAPEVLGYFDTDTSIYTFKADLWSLGCVLFYALTKKLPLRGYTSYSLYATGALAFPRQELVDNNISPLGIKFITKLMAPKPEKRLSASQALVHSWLVRGGSSSEELDEEELHEDGLDQVDPSSSSLQTDEHLVQRMSASIANPTTHDPGNEQARQKPRVTVEECTSFFVDYIVTERESLKTFFKDEDIPKLGEKAKTMFRAMIELGYKESIAQQLTLLILYDIVMLIDDSRSMKTEQAGQRIETLHRTIDEITRIYDYANENGIKSVKFLNEKRGIANLKNRNWKRFFDKKAYNGVTKIGTALNLKVLNNFVWGERMTKPLLVMIITDGDVEGEREGLLADVIADCVQRLEKDEQRGNQAVSFHFSRVGNDREGQRLLENLSNSDVFGDNVGCLPENTPLEMLLDRRGQHRWTVLPKLLLGAISTYWSEEEDDVLVDVTANIDAAPKEEDSDADSDY